MSGKKEVGLQQFLKEEHRFDAYFRVVRPEEGKASEEKESLYLIVRAKEGRLYTDEAVKKLPSVGRKHPLRKEWKIRGRSLRRLRDYLVKKERPLKILELGCGNGWFSHRLAEAGHAVYGVDTNRQELEQARRVFAGAGRLNFINADILNDSFHHFDFDIVVLPASVQYFPDLAKLLKRLDVLLAEGGEVHILDSPFYKPGELQAARERSCKYYDRLGFPEMARYYFHHSFEELSDRYFTVHRPRSGVWLKPEPFPWVIVKRG